MSPHGLGRGLSALIPGAPPPPEPVRNAQTLRAVPPEQIHPNPQQPRRSFPAEELEQLVASIRQHGILQPLVVTERPDGEYELIAGERRLRAATIAGVATVPVVVRDDAPDERAKLELALIENVQRQDLNPIERAIAYRQLHEEFGLTQEAVATRVGIARSSVAHTLRLLALPRDMQDAVASGKLSEGHAKVLLGMSDPAEQRAWFQRILEQRLPVAAVTAERTRASRPSSVAPSRTGDPNVRAKELALQQRLGAKVRIAPRTDGGGAITIEYTDTEELQGIIGTILT